MKEDRFFKEPADRAEQALKMGFDRWKRRQILSGNRWNLEDQWSILTRYFDKRVR